MAKSKKITPGPWSKQEETLLRKLYLHKSHPEIAEQLGRSAAAIMQRAHKLGFRKMAPLWSKKELDLLKKLYPSRMAEEIAEQIGRPVQAVRLRIFKLGLKKRKYKTKS